MHVCVRAHTHAGAGCVCVRARRVNTQGRTNFRDGYRGELPHPRAHTCTRDRRCVFHTRILRQFHALSLSRFLFSYFENLCQLFIYTEKKCLIFVNIMTYGIQFFIKFYSNGSDNSFIVITTIFVLEQAKHMFTAKNNYDFR